MAQDRLAEIMDQHGGRELVLQTLSGVIEDLPGRAKGWRVVAAALDALADPETQAGVLGRILALWTSLGEGEAASAFGADLAARLFRYLGERVQHIDPADPASIGAAWRLARALYADPAFGALGAAYPQPFVAFVRRAGQDPYLKDAVQHGADLSPCLPDALARFAVEPQRRRLRTLCRMEMAAAHGGLEAASERARRLLDDAEFHRPVVICGFHHSGTRLLARQLAALGVRQRINLYQYEWTYVVQLNSLLEPGCMDPGRLGAGGETADLIQPRRLAFRMALEGLGPGQTWGFKDPRNGLTATDWLKAFPGARIVHLLRDPVATLGTLPALYDRFLRLDERRPTRTRFWIDLWQAYVEGARRAMAEASAAIEIRFEDLCADPVGVLGQVDAALDLKAGVNAAMLSDAPIEAGKVDLRARVREMLDAADVEPLEALAGAYGY
jgi:hypothetical protein